MGQYTSYYLYQKFEQRGEQEAIPVYPNVYSIDADGTKERVVKIQDDPQCGYDPPIKPIYKWINIPITQDYICDDCPTYQTRWVRTDETICSGTPEPQYRWVNMDASVDYYCESTTKYYKQKKQVSYDGRQTWSDVVPAEYQKGGVAETESTDCGYVPTGKKLVATYKDGTTREVECNSSSALTYNEVEPLGYEYDDMTSAVIGDCVTSISSGAFRNYTISGFESLTSVTIPNSVTSIGSDAFNQCYKLTSITIPSGVTEIGYNAFEHCSGLTGITIEAVTPPTLDNDFPFGYTNDCPIYVPCQSVAAYKSATNWSAGANRILGIPPCEPTIFKFKANYSDGRTYVCECNDSTLLTSGETRNAMYSYDLMTSVTIGDCVTTIGSQAFNNGRSLTSVTILDSVTEIRSSAFSGCTSLTSIDIPNSVTSIGNDAFRSCSGLTNVNIPDSVISIGETAFYAAGLTSVIIPNSVTSIGRVAFGHCSGLTSVSIGSGVTSINRAAFQFCSSLTSIYIPDSVKSISGGAFDYCTSLTSCTIGSGVTSIGDDAFRYCSSLTSVTVNATTPPTLGGTYVFAYTNDCPIYVPAASVNVYKSASRWSSYADRIQPIT